jgi:type IX secretion system PorP/SprF family membrane protein
MKRLSILVLATALSIAAMAQDIHFSQFYMAPLQLNPAMTGVMNCNQRIGLNYRNQWASVLREKAFQTSQVAYDAKIPVGRYDYFGLGGSIWGDAAGSLNFRSTLLNLNFAYTKKMGGYRKKASYLSMGAKVGLAQRGLNLLAENGVAKTKTARGIRICLLMSRLLASMAATTTFLPMFRRVCCGFR